MVLEMQVYSVSPKLKWPKYMFGALPAWIITGSFVVIVVRALNMEYVCQFVGARSPFEIYSKWGEIIKEPDSMIASYFSEACLSALSIYVLLLGQ